MYTIGDNISGIVAEISKFSDKTIILIDVGNNEWSCKLLSNHESKELLDLLKVGDEIEGRIISKNIETKSIAIGQSNFGLFPPRPLTILRYFNSLLYFKKLLTLKLDEENIKNNREFISEMKGLVNRCLRKDQWDWLIIYRSFGFKDDSEVVTISKIFEEISLSFKLFNKNKISEIEFNIKITEFLNNLASNHFLEKVKNSIVYLNDESTNWEIMQVSTPMVNRESERTISKNRSEISLIKISSHIRRGVSMSNNQKERIINLLKRTDIKLSDGTVLTMNNFDNFDWGTQTIINDYEKEFPQGMIYLDAKETTVSESIDTNIKKERANIIHSQLVNSMANKLMENGMIPKSNDLIDLFATKENQIILFEMKSIHLKNEVSQIRKAIAQLYEYRYLHNFINANLCIVLNEMPSEKWLLEYILNDREILVCWLTKKGFECPNNIRDKLKGLVVE